MSEKESIIERLDAAEKLRVEANQRAKEIEHGLLKELKEERNRLKHKLAEVEKHIAKITGKPLDETPSAGKEVNKRIDATDTILEVIRKAGSITASGIMSSKALVELYAPRPVAPQAIKLASMVKAKQIKKVGKFKKATYTLA